MDKLNYTELAKNVCSELAIPPDAQVITILTTAFKRVTKYVVQHGDPEDATVSSDPSRRGT